MENVNTMAKPSMPSWKPRKMNYRISLGNQVPHMHWHLFPDNRAIPIISRQHGSISPKQNATQEEATVATLRSCRSAMLMLSNIVQQ